MTLVFDEDTLDQLAEALAERLASRLAAESDTQADGWFDSKAAAAYLGVPLSTVRKLTAARDIPFSQDQPGGRCYFQRSQLDGWRLAQSQEVTR